jgi:cell division protein FtsL
MSVACNLTFTTKEKVFAQFTYNAGVIVATYGLFLQNSALALTYFLFSYFGILMVVKYTVCPRCQYLNIGNDCVQLPASVMKILISPNRKGTMNLFEKFLLPTVLLSTLILPIYWISSNILILTIFLVFFGGHLLGLYIHFCPNCENKVCVQNRNRN